jgi:uncharacterized protein
MNKGMLPTATGSRPSFVRYLIGLYRSDTAFRGVVDFSAIGIVVLWFLGPLALPTFNGNRSPQQAPAKNAPTAPTSTSVPPATAPSTTQGPPRNAQAPSTPPVAGPAKSLPRVAFKFPAAVTDPKLEFTRIFDIDQAAFRNSAADLPRLSAAVRAARGQQFADIPAILANADAADPNVAFMRGIALIATGTAESNKSAEQSWRSASAAGQRQAALELARIAIYAPPGIAKDISQAQRTIEAAAAAGDRQAQRMAGIAHLSGQFGLNPTKARDYLRQAAQAGDVEAMLHYAFTLGWAIGGPADQAMAEDVLRRAAVAGLTLAQETLGIFLLDEYKEKLIDDPREGVEWLEKAVKSGYSIGALRALAFFLAAQTQPPWNDKSKVYELARLCSGISDGWCQSENGWVFQFGVGTSRDLVRAYAHYQVAVELGFSAAEKSMDVIRQQITAGDRTAAIDLSQRICAGLKPSPTIWDMQYVGVTPPASRWSAAEAPAATQASAREAATATCTHVKYRQFADLCNNCTAPPFNGELNRISDNLWTGTFVDGHDRRGTTHWRMTSRTSTEILLYDDSRDRYARVDFTTRKSSQRIGAGGSWVAISDILSTDCM